MERDEQKLFIVLNGTYLFLISYRNSYINLYCYVLLASYVDTIRGKLIVP